MGDFEQALMERLWVGVTDLIGPEAAAYLTLEEFKDVREGRLVAKLATKVLARAVIRDTRTYYVDHPTSWWQHLKYDLHSWRWFPRRIVRRWPVKYGRTEIAVHFRQYETYPKAKTMLPPSQFGYPIVVETAGHDIDSKFPILHDGGLTPENDCISKPELVTRILQYVFRMAPGHTDPLPMSPTDVYNVLEALESLGVHTAGLVRKDVR